MAFYRCNSSLHNLGGCRPLDLGPGGPFLAMLVAIALRNLGGSGRRYLSVFMTRPAVLENSLL